MSDLAEQIRQKMLALQQLERVEEHLADLDRRLQGARAEEQRLRELLGQRYDELAELERWSLRSVFFKILGSKTEEVEREREEYLQASIRYDAHQKTIMLLEYERGVLVEKWEGQERLKDDLEQLLRRRERELRSMPNGMGASLLRIHRQIEQQHLDLENLRTAIAAGQLAGEALDEIADLLQTDWKSRRSLATRYGQAKLARARERAIEAQQLLLDFERSLRQVYRDLGQFQLRIEVDHLARWSDLFWEQPISDWVIQQRIQDARGNVREVSDRVRRWLCDLEQRLAKGLAELAEREREKQALLGED